MLKIQTQLLGSPAPQTFEFAPQQAQDWDCKALNAHTFHIVRDGISYTAEVIKADYSTKTFTILVNKMRFELQLQDKFDLLLAQMGMDKTNTQKVANLKAPMPGLVIDVKVSEGQTVQKGESLLILEAMKMENVLKAPADVTIKAIKVQKGENVEKNHVLIVFA
jgi:acetyl/propionyl-CoA carboxylase alpha subunit